MVCNLPADICYGIDSSVECFHISEDVAKFFYRFNDDASIIDRIDNYHDAENDSVDRIHYALYNYGKLYTSHYNQWFEDSDTNELSKLYCLSGTSKYFIKNIAESIDSIYSDFIADSINKNEISFDSNNIQSFVHSNHRYGHAISYVANNYVKKVQSFAEDRLLYAFSNVDEINFLTAPTENLSISRNSIIREIDGDIKKIINKKKTKSLQKVLKKSSIFLSNLIGHSDTNAFIKGDAITVEGKKFNFYLKKKTIFGNGHGGFELRVDSKKTGEPLVNLCWYIPDTPIIDQLSALIMAIRVGDEEEIIKIGNFMRTHETAKKDKYFAKKFLKSSSQLPSTDDVLQVLENFNNDFEFHDRMFRYPSGTTQFIRNNYDTYLDFVRICNSLIELPFSEKVMEHYQLLTGQQIRNVDDRRYLLG